MAILYKYTFLNVSIQNRDSGRQKNDRGGGSIKKKFIKGRRSCFYQGKKLGDSVAPLTPSVPPVLQKESSGTLQNRFVKILLATVLQK